MLLSFPLLFHCSTNFNPIIFPARWPLLFASPTSPSPPTVAPLLKFLTMVTTQHIDSSTPNGISLKEWSFISTASQNSHFNTITDQLQLVPDSKKASTCIVFNLSDSFNPCHKLKHTHNPNPKFYVSTFPVITFKQLTDSLHTVYKMQRNISICLIKITQLPVMHMTP